MTDTSSPVQEKIIHLLDMVESTAKSGLSFASKETPEIVNDILRWNFWGSIIFSAIGAIVCLSTLVLSYYFRDIFWDDNFGQLTGWAFWPPIVFIAGLLGILANLEWVQVLIAPKLFLLEYAKNFLSKSDE